MAKTDKGIMDWEFDEIYEWCKEHGELAWLKKTGKKQVSCKVYPRKKVQKVVNGQPVFKNGKPVMQSVADYDAEPKTVQRRISFVQIKTEFLEKFGLAPAKQPKAPTMYDILDAIDE